ncbi:MAG: GNAT family N-acetyltransferase [bacterium]
MSEIIPFRKQAKPQDLVLRFMHSVGHKKDAAFYLNLFTKTKPENFAIIVLEEDILRDDLDAIIFEIRYLMRLPLYPVVLIRSADDVIENLEIDSYFRKAKIAFNILSDSHDNQEKLNFIKDKIKRRELPLLHSSPKVNIVEELTSLAHTLRTGKVLFLRRSGGIVNQETGLPLNLINLQFEKDSLLTTNVINIQDALFLSTCDEIIRSCDHKIHVSIVSPNNLLRELFTVKGAGSLIQLGSKIISDKKIPELDPRSLQKLIENSFEQKTNPSFFQSSFDHIYLEENYMGAALLREHDDMTYLSTFAVGTEARGLGIGRDLWQHITKNHSRLFWRSRPDMFITHWYTKQCDGMHRTKDWTVFWKGLDPEEVSKAISYAIKQKDDF